MPTAATAPAESSARRSVQGTRLAFFLPALEGGGAERVMMNLAAGFAEKGFISDMVLARAEGPMLQFLPSTVNVVDLHASRTLMSVLPLARYLRRQRPLALLAALDHANLVAMAAARLPGARTRTVISIHTTLRNYIADTPDRWARTIPRVMARCQGLADAIVAVSEGAAADFARLAHVSTDRVNVIYNAVVTPALMRAAAEPPAHPWFADEKVPVVLALGRLESNKNFKGLVDAFAIVKRRCNARLAIFGEGPERAALEAQVRRLALQDSVALPGYVDNPYSCMARAAAVVLSSDWEGLPTVLIESLALGTPVVSTDCPSGPREILENGALGRLVPVGDVDRMADAIEMTLRNRHAAPVQASLSRYTPEVVLAQYQRVLGLLP
jgi:glycosyltransferase involved in cell wall biosynthesis